MGHCSSKINAVSITNHKYANYTVKSHETGIQNKVNSNQKKNTDNPESFEIDVNNNSNTITPSIIISNFKKSSSTSSSSSSKLGLDRLILDRRHGSFCHNIVHMEIPFGKAIEEVYDGVHDGMILGSGISGLVRLCKHKVTGVKYATKCLDLKLVKNEDQMIQLREEIAIMCQLDHPNIIRLEEVYESEREIYLVQELCTGGELFDRLDELEEYRYDEGECVRLVKMMVCGVRYIHSKGIIHRDLKLENFLFSNSSPDSELKMIDFGLSKHFQSGDIQHEAVGTPYTVSPEVIRGTYDERCDVWAIGVISYLLLSGDPPFGGCGGPEPLLQVRSNILEGKYGFEPKDIWRNVSDRAKEFIVSLLVTDPNNRPTATDCQQLTWLRDYEEKNGQHSHELNPNVIQSLVNFKEYSDMRKLLCEVLSFTLLPDQIIELRKEFEKLDTDGSGEISLSGLKQVLIQNAGAGSLGALTETEVEELFHAMRIRKSETTIHWHEFIAAGLSQCKVDERNLQLAFERLDSDHKGYITLDNVMDILGSDIEGNTDAINTMWGDSMKVCRCRGSGKITYEDFVLLMKGQTKEEVCEEPCVFKTLDLVPEGIKKTTPTKYPASPKITPVKISVSPFGGFLESPSTSSTLGLGYDGPLTIECDSDEEITPCSKSKDLNWLTPTVVLNPKTQINTDTCKAILTNISPCSKFRPPLPDQLNISELSRQRSRSVDEADTSTHISSCQEKTNKTTLPLTSKLPKLPPGGSIRRAILLPHNDFGNIDETQTPLVINRKLYRAHRQLRLAVMASSKRLEEEQMRRTRMELRQRKEQMNTTGIQTGAGLVMKHGHIRESSSESIHLLLKQRQLEHEAKLTNASLRCGRGRRTRKKTTSDMSSMMLESDRIWKEEPNNVKSNNHEKQSSYPESNKLPWSRIDSFHNISTLIEGTEDGSSHEHTSDTCESSDTHEEVGLTNIGQLRKATVPGQFRKTEDPFLSYEFGQ